MTGDELLTFEVYLSNAENEATTWRLADTVRIVSQLGRGIDGIDSKDELLFKKEFAILLI